MEILYLIRHGETTHNRDGVIQGHTESDLSDLGLAQAERVRDRLDGVDLVKAYSSPMRRARETCRIALEGKVSIETHDGLKEINLGSWEGKSAADLRREYPKDVKLWFVSPTKIHIEGAETIKQFRDRVTSAVGEIQAKHQDQTIALFAHGGVICTYLTALLNMKEDDIWRFKIRNASVTRIIFPQNRPRIDLMGDVHHLEGVLREPPKAPFRVFP